MPRYVVMVAVLGNVTMFAKWQHVGNLGDIAELSYTPVMFEDIEEAEQLCHICEAIEHKESIVVRVS